ncbi:MAG: hypothetical protein AAB386_03415 [Patescibacteria group bacterium]
MKKSLFLLSTLSLVGAGCLVSSSIQDIKPQAEQSRTSEVKDVQVQVEQPTLDIEVTTQMNKGNSEPIGHNVNLSGVVNQSTFLANSIVDKETKLIDGEEVGRKGFYWAGAQNDLVFVKKDDDLQIQREIKGEDGDIEPRQAMFTLTIPKDTKITIK